MDIKDKIKTRRKALGLTMLEIANKVGVSEATVSRWESGDIANMRHDKIILLADALSTSVEYLMGWAARSKEAELFIENLTQIIQNTDSSELEEVGIDLDFIYEIIDGNQPLTFDIVCELTDMLGESIDEMIERNSFPKIIKHHIPLPCTPTENTIQITRRTGVQSNYTLSDENVELVEGIAKRLSESPEQIPGTIAAVTGEINKSGKKKKPTIL